MLERVIVDCLVALKYLNYLLIFVIHVATLAKILKEPHEFRFLNDGKDGKTYEKIPTDTRAHTYSHLPGWGKFS